MSKIRTSARGETCTIQIPGLCNQNPETVVLCHAPHPDKGVGKKGPDTWAAYGCVTCHDEMDRRTFKYFPRSPGEEEKGIWDAARGIMWANAVRETQRRLIAKGLMPK